MKKKLYNPHKGGRSASRSSKIGKALAMIGLGALTVFQPETAIVTIPLIIGIGKGK